ncbi:MAG: carboxylating nicotinate-nucleotide diphosphorylase [Candidatus Bathyarchaeota archaeon]|nr:carboxylating nicotinate-nucleotide diphosphorylase [Candidatus Bathyarchaeota archaeon]
MFQPRNVLEEKLLRLLEEDIGQGDTTTYLVIPRNTFAQAEIAVNESGIVAGLEEAIVLCESLGLQAEPHAFDGAEVEPRDTVLHIRGEARNLLSVERTLLNLLSRMSGIATATNSLVKKTRKAGHKVRIACTRKVAPGLAYFDKKAVFLGGGDTHRLHLDDLVLIKENHIKIAGNAKKAIEEARRGASFSKKIEVEIMSNAQIVEAVEAGADIIMLDNFSSKDVIRAMTILTDRNLRSKVLVEASGQISEDNILEYASTGVDIISIGKITHSARALDMSLDVVKVRSSKE